jgi:WD40 repeat protein
MRFHKILCSLILVSLLCPARSLLAQQAPGYSKDVRPFLARYCLECHSASIAKGDLDLETFEGLVKGGKGGPVLVPGKPDESRFVLLPEGKSKPPMPPKKAKQPRPDEVAVLRAWVAAGAKNDAGTITVLLPDIKPRRPTAPPIRALAYHPSGKLLAAGAHRDVVLLDLVRDEIVQKLPQEKGEVTAVAFSPDGQRLAVANSRPGSAGEVQLYQVNAQTWQAKPESRLTGHTDVILDLAFHPDGKWLATASYDRTVKIWDLATGRDVRTLRDHSDAVYGLAFSPDGKWLASAAADRAVKVWDVHTGARLYTLGEATDWLYTVAWSRDGSRLAAGGVDKSIRVWQVSAKAGKIVQSVFAHEGAVNRLTYSSDGKTLYSLSEDRTLKAWEAERMVERIVYAKQPEAVLAFAVRPDHQELALGRYDGTVALLEEKTGQVRSEPLPVKPKPPVLSKLTPMAGPRGRKLHIQFEGKYLGDVREVVSSHPGFHGKLLADGKSSDQFQAEIEFPAQTPAGVYKLAVKTPAGQTEMPFTVDLYPEQIVQGSSDSPRTAGRVTLPATVAGVIARAGGVAFYRFEATSGYQLGAQALTGVIGSKLDPVLQLVDPDGRVVAESSKGLLGYTCPKPGAYALGIRDREYRGGPEMLYRLHMGDIPMVTGVFPLGLQRGTDKEIRVEGVNLGTRYTKMRAPADAVVGSRLPVSLATPTGPALGDARVLVGEFPEVSAPGTLPVPGTANGRINEAGATETWRFAAGKGQRLIVEVNARRIGSPLDSTIEILDAKGQPVPRAVLRCVAKTYTVFRDHDSTTSAIRIENWDGFAMNDYAWVGNELIRIFALPKNPDDDCQFYSAGSQRLGYLGTTPTYLSMGQPLYKVTVHPPGTEFAPNGFPVVHLNYRNDDGGPGYGKDSLLFFDPPEDGAYQVRVGDARGEGGSNYAYRLTVRPPQPSFQVSFTPTAPAVWQGSALPVTVSAERLDGFDGPIDIQLENLPPGFSAPRTSIPAGENSTTLALWAELGTKVPSNAPPLKLVARASIAGREVVRSVAGGLPKVMEPGDIATSTEQSEITLEPGHQVFLTAKIDRRHGFKGRVPLDVRGLPHGVYVLDIGLNGILITESNSTRTFAIYAEPWVQPTAHPFVVLARHEGKGTEYAARSVLLKVVGRN